MVVPLVSVIIFVVNFGTKLTEKLDGVIERQDKIEIKVDNGFRNFQGQIDTIKTRQLQYHYENKIYQAEQKGKR